MARLKNGINVWALDIETMNWTEIVLYKLTDKNKTYTGYTREQMVKDYCKIPDYDLVISHNGGRFDFLPLLDGLEASWKITLANGIINMRAENHALLIDSYRLFVLSLDKWTNRKTKLPFICTCGKDCGGYCKISKTMSKADMKILEDYCINDCYILLDYYIMHLDKLDKDGFAVFNKSGMPRSTIGAVAYNTAKKWCGLPDGKLEHGDYKLTKSAYYGGNNTCISKKSDELDLYDINSAYPAEQLKELPVGDYRSVTGAAAIQEYLRGTAGLYYIKAYQDPCNLAMLPRRMGNGRVVWATGWVEGYYVLREAQLAEREARFFEIKGAMVWDKTEAIYAPYIETCYKLRQDYKAKGDNYEHVVKILLNSLYGKLAQNTKQTTLHYFEHVDDTPDTENLQMGVEWEPIHGTKYWIETRDNIVPESAKPYQAAYITGNVRANMFDFCKPFQDEIAYIDTDCIYKRPGKKPTNLDNEKLGFFKYEGRAYNWRSVGPKVYNYSRVVKNKAKEVKVTKIDPELLKYILLEYKPTFKAKGLPFLGEESFNNFLNGMEVVNDRGVNGIISSLKRSGSAFTRRNLKRTNNAEPCILGTRFVTGDETSLPLHYENNKYSWPSIDADPLTFLPWLK